MRILVAEPKDFCAEAHAILNSLGSVDLRTTSQSDLAEAVCQYDVIWFRLGLRFDEILLANPQRKTRYLCTPVTGIDHIDLESCRRHDVSILCLKGEREFLKRVRATAELTIGMTLAVLRHIPEATRHVLDGGWNRDLFRGSEIFAKTVGIVGYGRLGAITAEYFHALGATVLAYDPFVKISNTNITTCPSLSELCRRSDIVSLHVSYDESTRHLIDEAVFRSMKPGAVLINTSRGGLVDEAALVTALDGGTVSAAALDVVEGEPCVDHRHNLVDYARHHSNLLLTPHIGGNTHESFVKTEVFLAEKLRRSLPRKPHVPGIACGRDSTISSTGA